MPGASKKFYINKNGDIITYFTGTWYDMYGKQHTGGHFKTRAAAIKYAEKQEKRPPDIAK